MQKRLSLMLDTNVLLDYFDTTRPGCESATKLVNHAIRNGLQLMVSPMSLKDFYYLVAQGIKREAGKSGKEIDDKLASAAESYAWNCTREIMDVATILSVDSHDVELASNLHELHVDFEDDLLLAVAMRSEVAYLVTGDEHLAAKSTVPTMNAADLVKLLQVG
ncbi:MAG: type II toxin-antitoxin system VapC family toxin [Coriobacteriales bacterium]|jgi:predicted nucleic acid-binding protein